MDKEEEEIKFIDADTIYGETEGINRAQIVMMQVKRISDIASKEPMPGHTEIKRTTKGEFKIYVPDTRIEYINSVDFLYDILIGDFDADFKQRDKKIKKEFKKSVEEIKKKFKIESKFINPDNPAWQIRIEEQRKLWRELFQELCLLLSRLDWLGASSYEE